MQGSESIAVVIDNDEWMLPFCETLVKNLSDEGKNARLCRSYESIADDTRVSFFLSCHQIASADILQKSQRNLVVHASALPSGRGMSPLTWQILEGVDSIPVCLIEAEEKVDSGAIVYTEIMELQGHELIGEIRQRLGEISIGLCQRFLNEEEMPEGCAQKGEADYYSLRTPEDSRIDPNASIASQFNLFRVVDNERYPAYFDLHGHRYQLRISKMKSKKP